VLAADCKYKRTESEAYKNHDYYQILAYYIATGVKQGMLIYPLDAVATDDTVQVRKTCISIEQKTINLGLPFKQFQQECGHFAGEVLSLATLSALKMSA
jgi:5-methylcytosine-specific restriction endonuclease McrBC regulatory subunit McrC